MCCKWDFRFRSNIKSKGSLNKFFIVPGSETMNDVYMSHAVYEIDFSNQLNLLDSASFIYTVSKALTQKKRLCWVSGGAVRDMWLGRTPVDIDLVTDASDEEIAELFPKAILVGQKFGVYKLPFFIKDRNIIIDLTVFREEDEYVDGRRPQSIKRAGPLADAQRRDFTVNALFYDLEKHQVLDYVGGISDLENKILRCVGDADRRLKEDHLRLLRLTRFKAQFGFTIPEADLKAASANVELIRSVSGERIYDEILKVIKSRSESLFWGQELTAKLWQALGAEFNSKNLVWLPALKNFAFSVEQQFVMNVVILWNHAPEAIDFLKARLKCSKDEAGFAKKAVDLKHELSKKPEALALALHLDKDRAREESLLLLQFYAACGECPSSLSDSVMAYFNEFPKPLMSGADLKNRCEPVQIAVLLQTVRKAQFEKKIRTSSEALIFLQDQNLIN
ncbi:hypothetical protein CIK05_09310 [Bdellovibrio sp. qaytius]|nr:hypothetical protein CIK05_09310 [Bdellovibrio sp. qaytius]